MIEVTKMTDDRNTKTPKHGWVISPASRGSRAIDLGFLLEWEVDELEGVKIFPTWRKGHFQGTPQTNLVKSRLVMGSF